MDNLWSFDEDLKMESPIEILKSQVEYLEKMTGKFVSASLIDVKQETNEFKYIFSINSPYLPNYSFKAFTIKCSPIFYPVTIDCDSNIAKELSLDTIPYPFETDDYEYVDIICNDTEEYKSKLKQILGTKYMNQVVAAIKLMAKSEVPY